MQSVAVRLVVEREQEIMAFVPDGGEMARTSRSIPHRLQAGRRVEEAAAKKDEKGRARRSARTRGWRARARSART